MAEAKPLCGATTTKGKPCKQPVSIAGQRCRYHNKERKVHRDRDFKNLVPVIAPELLELLDGDDASLTALRAKLRTAGTTAKKDEPGWIYVYWLDNDDDTTYFKIGRTAAEDPQTRIGQWPGAKMRYAVRVPFNQIAEGLVHTLLAGHRLYRYVFKTAKKDGGTGGSGKMYMTTWFKEGTLLRDAAYRRLAYATGKPPAPYSKHVWEQVRKAFLAEDRVVKINFGTRSKEVEWFQVRFSVIRQVIEGVAASLREWDAAQRDQQEK